MKKIIKLISILAISIIITISFLGCHKVATKENTLNTVIDEINILTEEEKKEIAKIISELKDNVGSEIVLLIISTTGNQSIEQYSIKKAEELKIGRKEYNDGILITFALNDRKIRIEVGYGLEKIIKDEIASHIIRNTMTPHFKEKKYYLGLKNGTLEIVELITINEKLVGITY